MRGDIRGRADVSFSIGSYYVTRLYAHPRFQLAPLGSLITRIQYGTSALATTEPVGLPIIRMNNLQADGWDFSDLKYIELSADEAESYRVEPGDILFNRTNSKELVGKCEVFRQAGHWVFASYLIRISLDQSRALPEFVSTFLNTRGGRAQIDQISRQIVGMANINAEEIKSLGVPLPPLEIQRQLVTEMESARQSRQAKLAQADELLTGIDAFVLDQLGLSRPSTASRLAFAIRLYQIRQRYDPQFYLPHILEFMRMLEGSEHRLLTLSDLAQRMVSGQTPLSGGSAYGDQHDGIPFIQSAHIAQIESLDFQSVSYLRREVHEGIMENSQLRYGDVLVAIVGATIGKVGVYRHNREANINQAVAAISLRLDAPSADFVMAVLSSSVGQLQFERLRRPVARANINLKELGSIIIPIPDVDTQNVIVAEVSRRREAARRLRAEADSEWAAAKAWFESQLLGEA